MYAFSYLISAKELNANIQTKFPIEKRFLLSKFIFSKPKLEIDKKTDLIFFECDAYNTSIVLDDGETPVFRVYAKSDIRYDGDNLYLEKVKIDKIQNKHLSKSLEENLIIGMEFLLNVYFDKKPIYSLEDSTYSLELAKSMISDVVVDDGNIKILIME